VTPPLAGLEGDSDCNHHGNDDPFPARHIHNVTQILAANTRIIPPVSALLFIDFQISLRKWFALLWFGLRDGEASLRRTRRESIYIYIYIYIYTNREE
jgi:hypothetical protein